LVAQGYSQIPGVDFSENYAPVINDTTFRAVLSLIQKESMIAYPLEVETAFLHGKLEEEMFMNVPEGYSEDPDFIKTKAMRLKKAIYGLVQAAR
jgi:hypothetical protein